MKIEDLKQGLSSLWDTLAEGWQHLRQSASTSLTGFKPGDQTNLPDRHTVDDVFYLPSMGWAMVGGDVYEDDRRVIVKLELPGLRKDDIDVKVHDDLLVVQGEKRFMNEETEGRYRVLQCAYGSFRRSVALPAVVVVDQAKATYENGVLRVELPKTETLKPESRTVKID